MATTVLVAADGIAAVRAAADHAGPIHLLLTDVVMPRMGGKQLADLLRAVRPGLKTLFVSGYTESAIDQDGVLDPGVAFLQKPFTIDSLRESVRNVLEAPKTENV